jgi:hypothetical protein
MPWAIAPALGIGHGNVMSVIRERFAANERSNVEESAMLAVN